MLQQPFVDPAHEQSSVQLSMGAGVVLVARRPCPVLSFYASPRLPHADSAVGTRSGVPESALVGLVVVEISFKG